VPEARFPGEPATDALLDAYLDALAAALRLPGDERDEVRAEIRGHLLDARSEFMAVGLGPDRAGAEALRRLGSAEILAREITRARQTHRALLAAVGGATWAATGAAARGLLLGIAAVLVVSLLGALGIGAASRVAGNGTWTLWDAGWFTALGAAACWVAAALAGRTFVSAAARRSHRPAESVRPWVAGLGGALVVWLALAWFVAPQNLVSVIALALVPAIFVAAALTGSDRPMERSRRDRVATLTLLAAVLIALPLVVLLAATPVQTQVSSVGSGPYATPSDLLHASGFDLPGRYVADPPPLGAVEWRLQDGLAVASLGAAASVGARWHDLRLEAWRALPGGTAIDRADRAPFATAPLTVQSDQLVGAVRVDRTRDVSLWWVVVTGIAPDGGRDLIVIIGGGNSTFSGSAWDRLTAS